MQIEADVVECKVPVTRRTFVKGLAIGGLVGGLGLSRSPLFCETVVQSPSTLSGTHFELEIAEKKVNFTGRQSAATVVNNSLPAPTLRWRQGDLVTLAVTNRLKVPTSLHWHGVRVSSAMDGVPGLSFAGIRPGETFVYRIPVRQSGTYWYHSHSAAQEQTGLAGAVIIDPAVDPSGPYDREYVVILADWTDTDPRTVFSNLKQDSEYYNFHQRTLGTFIDDARKNGLGPTISNRRMWGRMNMTPTDISDVTGATYTFLMNGNNPASNWTALFKPGERVRLRFINSSAMTLFDVRLPGLTMTVVQADGNEIEPVVVDEFRIGNAETYDVIVEPRQDTAYSIFAQAIDRTGYARGTLAPRLGMTAEVPAMDPRPMRTMVDMGMGMAGMKAMSMPTTTDPKTPRQMPAMGMNISPAQNPTTPEQMPGMDMNMPPEQGSSTTAIDRGEADVTAASVAAKSIVNVSNYMPFPQPGPSTSAYSSASPLAGAKIPVDRTLSHVGPQVDGISMAVSERLSDPGDGLQSNGRRVLTYADLRARYRGVDGRLPTREIELHLTGNMQRYIWGFDGRKFSDSGSIELKLGERVRFTLINDSMMDHPIHLHGMWSEVETGQGEFNPYKHTVIVKPSERVTFLVSADTPGRWALHCHLMFHMEAGMFRTVVVS
ncbi:MAG TPA: copper resistance system multicopper oxidase [Acidisarcina sp.]